MTTTTYLPAECVHGMEPYCCAICKARAGYRPGTDRQEGDCGVESFTELTGADYGEALELLAAAGRTAGAGTTVDTMLTALAAAGFTATPAPVRHGYYPTTGAYLCAAWIGGKGHAFTIIDGTLNRAGRWAHARNLRMWRVA